MTWTKTLNAVSMKGSRAIDRFRVGTSTLASELRGSFDGIITYDLSEKNATYSIDRTRYECAAFRTRLTDFTLLSTSFRSVFKRSRQTFHLAEALEYQALEFTTVAGFA